VVKKLKRPKEWRALQACRKKASHVIVLTVQGGTVPGPTGEELARYLHRNGVLCEPITVQPEGRSTGEAILAYAASLQCVTC
jgi:hypothetical protein